MEEREKHKSRDAIACIFLLLCYSEPKKTDTQENEMKECLTYTCLIMLLKTKYIKKHTECIDLQLILDASLFT